jgi:hypothetical protein
MSGNAQWRSRVDAGMGLVCPVPLVIVLALGLATSQARAQNFGVPQADRYFRVEWSTAQTARRGPVVQGYVYETYGRPADQMRLGIDGLDASGNVTTTTVGEVMGMIPGGGRAYFEVPPASIACAFFPSGGCVSEVEDPRG